MPVLGRRDTPTTAVLLSGALCLAVFLASMPLPRPDGHLIGSDGFHYFAITRSLVLGGDLDLADDYRALGQEALQYPLSPTGRVGSPFAIGTPLLWAPAFVLANLIASALAGLGAAVRSDGVGPLYEAFVCAASIAYGTAGFLLVRRALSRGGFAQDGDVSAALLALWWATPAAYYITVEPSMSHAATLLANGLVFACWRPDPGAWGVGRWAAVGAATGLAALVRWQDGVVILVPLAWLAWRAITGAGGRGAALARGLALGIGALAAFAPQLAMWRGVYGRLIVVPQGNDFMVWSGRFIPEVLFSTKHGLLSWHPVYLLALAGMVPLFAGAGRRLAVAVAAVFALHLAVNGSVAQWWAGDAFGARRFVSVVPYLCAPLAALSAWARGAGTALRRGLVAALVALALWNGLAFLQYRFGFVSPGEALTWREMTIERFAVPARLLDRFVRSAEPPPSGPPKESPGGPPNVRR